ncbi:hypothetical protein KTR9_2597 [Gordonia sp. KTR9]|nr:hypothetical protein KTR9_2597 [Gordonia sp. KTR9]
MADEAQRVVAPEHEEVRLRRTLEIHGAQDGVVGDPAEDVVDRQLVVDHRGRVRAAVPGGAQTGTRSSGATEETGRRDRRRERQRSDPGCLLGDPESAERDRRVHRPQSRTVAGREEERMHGLGVDELFAPPAACGQESVQGVPGGHFGATPGADHEVGFDRGGRVEQVECLGGRRRRGGQELAHMHAVDRTCKDTGSEECRNSAPPRRPEVFGVPE